MPAVAHQPRASEREEQAALSGHLRAPRSALAARPEEVSMIKIARRFLFAALATLALLPSTMPAALARQQPTQFPLSIADDTGATSTFAASPRRVVSLNPGLTEITYALGADNRLVAVDSDSDYPPETPNRPAPLQHDHH